MRGCVLLAALAALSRVVTGSTLRALNINSAFANEEAGYEEASADLNEGIHYMPEHNALICACAKCGSTSLFGLIYLQIFGTRWNFTGPPFIQEVLSTRWGGKWRALNDTGYAEKIHDNSTFSFALMRDPKERIISAWKSKVACEESWGTDIRDRNRIVPELRKLAERPNATCLSFVDFVDTLAAVHRKGLAQKLNPHFRPQHLNCFRTFKPEEWTVVAPISNAEAAQQLASHLGNVSVTGFENNHGSGHHGTMKLTATASKVLYELTKPEYAVLPHLHHSHF